MLRLLPAVCTFKWKWHIFYLEQNLLSLELYDSPEQHWQVLQLPHAIKWDFFPEPQISESWIIQEFQLPS